MQAYFSPYRRRLQNLGLALLIIATGLCVLEWGKLGVRALPYGVGTFGSCQYGSCGITIVSNGTINLNVTPTSGGVYTVISDTMTVATNSSTGYTVTMRDSDTNTALTKGSETIPASSGTQAEPITLALNTWGYRVDGVGSFGAGPTSAQTNSTSNSSAFAGVPASDQPEHTIRTSSEPTDPSQTTTVWYGVRADTSKSSGTYSNQVTYTAVTND